MLKESIAYRVDYPNGAVYHLIASTDTERVDCHNEYFRGIEYTPDNGVASFFTCSEGAKRLDKYEQNLFVPHGTAKVAAEKLIEKLNKLNDSKPLFVFEY